MGSLDAGWLAAPPLQDVLCNMAMVGQLAPLLSKARLPEELAVQVRCRWHIQGSAARGRLLAVL
jgi:hypothetical protein